MIKLDEFFRSCGAAQVKTNEDINALNPEVAVTLYYNAFDGRAPGKNVLYDQHVGIDMP